MYVCNRYIYIFIDRSSFDLLLEKNIVYSFDVQPVNKQTIFISCIIRFVVQLFVFVWLTQMFFRTFGEIKK